MKKYFLYDSQTKVQHQKLSLEDVKELFANTLPSERENLYGWYKGQADWLPLKEIPEFASLFSIEQRSEYENVNYDPSEKTHVPSYTGVHNLENLIKTSQIVLESAPAPQQFSNPNPQMSSAPISIEKSTPVASETRVGIKPRLDLKIKIQPKVSASQTISPVAPTQPPDEIGNNPLMNLSTPIAIPISPSMNLNPIPQPMMNDNIVPISQEPSGRERRKFTRYDIKLRVIITNKKNTFLTFTKDVSLGGLQLINDIPEYIFHGESEVFISGPNNRDNIKFKCRAVGDNQHKSRLQFENSDQVLLEKLQVWIDHIVKPKAKSA